MLLGVGAGEGKGGRGIAGAVVLSGVAVSTGVSSAEGIGAVGRTELAATVGSAVGGGVNWTETGFAQPAERRKRRMKSSAIVFFMVR